MMCLEVLWGIKTASCQGFVFGGSQGPSKKGMRFPPWQSNPEKGVSG